MNWAMSHGVHVAVTWWGLQAKQVRVPLSVLCHIYKSKLNASCSFNSTQFVCFCLACCGMPRYGLAGRPGPGTEGARAVLSPPPPSGMQMPRGAELQARPLSLWSGVLWIAIRDKSSPSLSLAKKGGWSLLMSRKTCPLSMAERR